MINNIDSKVNNKTNTNYNINYTGGSNKTEFGKIKTDIKDTINKITENHNVIEEMDLSPNTDVPTLDVEDSESDFSSIANIFSTVWSGGVPKLINNSFENSNKYKELLERINSIKNVELVNEGILNIDIKITFDNGDFWIYGTNGKLKSQYELLENGKYHVFYTNGIEAYVDSNGGVISACINGENINIFGEYNKTSNQFGGSQMDFEYNIDELLKDPIVMKKLKTAFPDASMEDYELYLIRICNVGCGYTAIVNEIFNIYQGKEDEFSRTFGFPMYTIDELGNIDYNYEYLILDIFTDYWKDKGTIQELYGDTKKNSIDQALSGENINAVATGVGPLETEEIISNLRTKYNIHNLSFEYVPKKEFSEELIPGTAEYQETLEKYAEWYEKETGTALDTSLNYELHGEFDINKFSEWYNNTVSEGKQIILCSSNFDLDYINGLPSLNFNVGPHAMSIVEIKDDGKLIVSSWGDEYLLDLSDPDIAMIYFYVIENGGE